MKFKVKFVEDDPYATKPYYELSASGNPPITKSGAIHASIAKWKALVDFHTTHGKEMVSSINGSTCALCMAFYNDLADEDQNENTCEECPVFERTGKNECSGTPYARYARTGMLKDAQAELEFLMSL